jgi:hypothetical protein
MRLRSQRLDDGRRAPDTVATIVRAVGGVQAQDERAAALGIRVRGRMVSADDIHRARVDDRSIVRAWCMRGTLHLIPSDLLPALLAIFGPVYVARGRRRLAQLGLDDDAARRGTDVIGETLARRGRLTRHEIAEALRHGGVAGDPHDRATVHLIRRACLLGIACDASSTGEEPSYALRDDWLAPTPIPDRTSELGRLADWYVAAYQPTSRDDFAAWSGLPVADVTAAWGQTTDLVAVGDAGQRLWRRADEPEVRPPIPTSSGQVRLLPAFDGYLLGYRGRDHALPAEHAAQVHPGGGIIRPTVLVDGRVVGTWRIDRTRARLVIQSFAGLGDAPVAAVETEVADVGRFTGRNLTLTMVGRRALDDSRFGVTDEPLRT